MSTQEWQTPTLRKFTQAAVNKWADTPVDKRDWCRAAMAFGTAQNFILYGVPGTGKSYTVQQWLDANGVTYVRPIIHDQSSADELTGVKVQVIDPTTGNSKFDTHIGPLVDAYANGKVFLWDEMNRASEECLTLGFLALDGLPIDVDIVGEGVRTYKPHPNFRCIGFSNDHVDEFPGGLKRRMHAKVAINDLAPGLWAAIPKSLHKLVQASAFEEDTAKRITGAEWQLVAQWAQDLATKQPDGRMLPNLLAALALATDEERAEQIHAQWETMKATAR